METEIGNRGSKSIIGMPIHTFVIIVNEQRVDGSWWEKYKNKCISRLRCTLLGFDRNFKVSYFSVGSPQCKALRGGEPWGLIPIPLLRYGNETEKIKTYISYSTKIRVPWAKKKVVLRYSLENFQLDPWWVTGFVDGEGCFHVSITKNPKLKVGWDVKLTFSLGLHERDKSVIKEIMKFLKVGSINFEHGLKTIQYRVLSIKELKVILEHLDKYPLRTQKQSDYLALKLVYLIIKNKEHLTPEGLRKIVAIKASMNRGLSDKLQLAFPDVVPSERPVVSNSTTLDPNWLAGFVAGEGSFMINIRASKKYSVGFQVILVFVITQHLRDQQLLICIMKYLGCGNVYKKGKGFDYRVSKLSDIEKKIIPFFKKYPIVGVKTMDFADFCKVAEMMNKREHLSAGGLEKIKQIKARMNLGRKLNC